MGKVIRIVRVPDWSETLQFELSLPKGAEIFKAGGVFAGVVDSDGTPVPTDSLFMLVREDELETEVRRFQAAFLTSGLDDLTSEVPALPGTAYRYISDISNGFMLFEALDPLLKDALPETDVPIVRI